MLGATQLAEVEAWLSASTATFKFVISSVQWRFLAQNEDSWYGFQAQRAQIFEYISDQAIPGVILLSGDRHWVGVFRHEAVAPYYLYRAETAGRPGAATLGADGDARGGDGACAWAL